MPEVVVLGPTSYVGSALIRELLPRGIGVRTGNRQDFDFFQPKTYVPLFRGATHLFLLTPVTDQMVELTEALLQAAKQSGIRHIVRLSALGANPQSSVRLFRWHGECERLVETTGLPWTVLRPNAFMQNFLRFQGPSIRRASRISAPAGLARISFIDAQDVAKVAARSLLDQVPTESVLELTGPESLSYTEVARSLSLALLREIQYEASPDTEARINMGRAGFPPWKVDALLELHQYYRQGNADTLTQSVADVLGVAAKGIESFFIQHREEFL